MRSSRLIASLTFVGLALTACSGSDTTTTPEPSTTEAPIETPATARPADASIADQRVGGLRLVSPDIAKAALDDAPPDLVVLDVRTPEEFAEGHIDGAVMIDFYRTDFAAELAALDPDVPYVLYCRSGNRSGQTLQMMAGLGFLDVQDVDGGVLGWQQAGLPLVTD